MKNHQRNYRPKKRIWSRIVPFITLTVITALVSAALAGVWQLLDPVDYIAPEKPTRSESSQAESPPDDGRLAPNDNVISSMPESPSSSSAVEKTTLVAKSDWVDSNYFDDALFIGDSITEGIKIYDIMSNAKVLSHTGINLDSIHTRKAIKTDSGELTIMEAAAKESPGKIYVMMGANSMSADRETFINGYTKLVTQLRDMHPNAIIYVQSILPVTTAYEERRPDFSNGRIDEYNEGLLEMSEQLGVYYLNVAEAFKNEDGKLPTEASPKDGMHFSSSWYRKWFDYLRTHTAPAA